MAFHEQTEERKADVSERAAADRIRVEETYQTDVQGIIDSVVAFHTRTQAADHSRHQTCHSRSG